MIAEKIVHRWKTDPASFDMSTFVNACGTAGCLAGHIVWAGGYGMICPPLSAGGSPVGAGLLSLEAVAALEAIPVEQRVVDEGSYVGELARTLWAREYGIASAKALPFYEYSYEDDERLADIAYNRGDCNVLDVVSIRDVLARVPELKAAWDAYEANPPKPADPEP